MIMASFTMEEQRFVLAEIIKSSPVDIGKLADFIKSNGVVPNWYDMQLPSGRSMNQCIKFAQSLSIPIPIPSNQPQSISHYEHAVQNISNYSRYSIATTSPLSHHPGLPPPSGHYDVLPRPTNGVDEIRMPLSPAPKSPARKRGRPSRSDPSRQSQQPRYPTPIAPRPPPAAPGSNVSNRTILPAQVRPFDPHPPAPLVHPPPSLKNGSQSRKRRRANSPPPTPVVNRTSPPPLPPPASPPPLAIMPIAENDSDGREHSDQSNTKTPTPESSS